MKLLSIFIFSSLLSIGTWLNINNTHTANTIILIPSEYSGCQDGPEGIRNQTLKSVFYVLSSQSSYYIEKRSELGMSGINPEQIHKLEEPIDIIACEQINTVLNQLQVAWDDPELSPVYYKADGFYFASFGVQSGRMLGFTPVYTFNQDFELIFIWVV